MGYPLHHGVAGAHGAPGPPCPPFVVVAACGIYFGLLSETAFPGAADRVECPRRDERPPPRVSSSAHRIKQLRGLGKHPQFSR